MVIRLNLKVYMNNQPSALSPLFLTEACERFSFYIIQVLLIFYMIHYLNLSDESAYAIVGEYIAFIYISPILGGFLANEILGARYSILLGGAMLCIGYSLLASQHNNLMFWALSVLILGNGFFKPNISSFLSGFYGQVDKRRQTGFAIFYLGINIGSMIATLTAGYLQRHFGWNITFTIAAIGMFFSLFIYLAGFKNYADKGLATTKSKQKSFFSNKVSIAIIFFGTTCIVYLFLKHPTVGYDFLILAAVTLFTLLIYTATRFDDITRNKLFALTILLFISIIFWAIFFQIFLTVNLYTDRLVDRHFLGTTIPPSTFISLEPIFIVLLSMPISNLWKYLAKKKCNPMTAVKFSTALFFIAIAMAMLASVTYYSNAYSQQVSPIWMVFFYLLLTIGEILLSPVGLAMINELAPKRLESMMTNAWFMSLGFGGALTGILAQIASIPRQPDPLNGISSIYQNAFTVYALIALILGVFSICISPWIKKLICYHSYRQG